YQSRFDTSTLKLLNPTWMAVTLISVVHGSVHALITPSPSALAMDLSIVGLCVAALVFNRRRPLGAEYASLAFVSALTLVVLNVVVHRLLGAESTPYTLGVLLVCVAFTLIAPVYFVGFTVLVWVSTLGIQIATGAIQPDALFLLFMITCVSCVAYFARRNRQIELEQTKDELQAALSQSQEALAESERLRHENSLKDAQLRVIAENITDVVYIYDAEGTIQYVSPSIEALLGYRPNERLGTSYRDSAMMPESIEKVAPLFEQALAGKLDQARVEIRHITKTGEGVWTETTGRSIRDDQGRVTGICVVVRDITQRRAAEAQLRDSEARYRSLTERSLDPILSFDRRANITYANPAAQDLWGVGTQSLIGARHDIGQTVDSKTRSGAALARLESGETDHEQLEIEHAMPDGRRIWSEIHAWPVFKDEQFSGFQFIARDITNRKAASEKLERQQRRLSGRTRELAMANQQLDKFAATVTHDLRAPVRRLLRQLEQSPDSNINTTLVSDIANQLKELDGLIVHLLTTATERDALQIVEIDIGQVVRRIVSRQSLDTGRECVLTAPEIGESFIKADEKLCTLLFENLIANAYKFNPSNKTLEVGVFVTQDGVVSLTDNGDGFPMHDPSVLFEFSNQANTTKAGYGIGLSTAKSIVERHRGSITLTNTAEGGACVEFSLGHHD
ncbi:MAG: PAS domain-containing sensor histidine kinase, partial [Pseudomonadota bacterium]